MLYAVDALGLCLVAALVAYCTTEGEPVNWIKSEVPLLLGLVQAVLALLIAFGLDLTIVQTGAILAASAAVLAVVTRSQVSPKSP